jgi:hypothetical protein
VLSVQQFASAHVQNLHTSVRLFFRFRSCPEAALQFHEVRSATPDSTRLRPATRRRPRYPYPATVADQSLIAFQKSDRLLKILTAFWALEADHVRVDIWHRSLGSQSFILLPYIVARARFEVVRRQHKKLLTTAECDWRLR